MDPRFREDDAAQAGGMKKAPRALTLTGLYRKGRKPLFIS
jgi:hypothetical protein